MFTISARSRCTSGASGVVWDAMRVSLPLSVQIVPMTPVLYPASRRIPAVRNAVVVLPFVPVIPIIFSFRAG